MFYFDREKFHKICESAGVVGDTNTVGDLLNVDCNPDLTLLMGYLAETLHIPNEEILHMKASTEFLGQLYQSLQVLGYEHIVKNRLIVNEDLLGEVKTCIRLNSIDSSESENPARHEKILEKRNLLKEGSALDLVFFDEQSPQCHVSFSETPKLWFFHELTHAVHGIDALLRHSFSLQQVEALINPGNEESPLCVYERGNGPYYVSIRFNDDTLGFATLTKIPGTKTSFRRTLYRYDEIMKQTKPLRPGTLILRFDAEVID